MSRLEEGEQFARVITPVAVFCGSVGGVVFPCALFTEGVLLKQKIDGADILFTVVGGICYITLLFFAVKKYGYFANQNKKRHFLVLIILPVLIGVAFAKDYYNDRKDFLKKNEVMQTK